MQQRRNFTLTEIGVFHSSQKENYQAGRQPDALGKPGEISFFPHENFEQALQDLEGCTHLWVIFGFHKNEHWKPLVQTPRSDRKIGVFATRAPYRPNPIGLSLVKLIQINKLKILVSENDILDGSPIFDIKPYHPESDVANEAHIEWLENSLLAKHQISFSPFASEQLDWLEQNQVVEIKIFILRQLEYDPLNKSKKRVEEKAGYYTLSYRTWRVDFSLSENKIGVLAVHSGYSAEELKSHTDTYQDKAVHRKFNQIYNS